jgi:hypothetical protein
MSVEYPGYTVMMSPPDLTAAAGLNGVDIGPATIKVMTAEQHERLKAQIGLSPSQSGVGEINTFMRRALRFAQVLADYSKGLFIKGLITNTPVLGRIPTPDRHMLINNIPTPNPGTDIHGVYNGAGPLTKYSALCEKYGTIASIHAETVTGALKVAYEKFAILFGKVIPLVPITNENNNLYKSLRSGTTFAGYGDNGTLILETAGNGGIANILALCEQALMSGPSQTDILIGEIAYKLGTSSTAFGRGKDARSLIGGVVSKIKEGVVTELKGQTGSLIQQAATPAVALTPISRREPSVLRREPSVLRREPTLRRSSRKNMISTRRRLRR